MDKFIASLDLPFKGKQVDKYEYILDLDNSDDFSKLYQAVSNKLEQLEDISTQPNLLTASFTDGTYQVDLIANFDLDIYRMVVSER